jgi:exopolyphosphatase/guanosine-5'-triphosphate,3'-diphosphate pyrophosphatase
VSAVPADAPRIASIDVGSNGMRIEIAAVRPDGTRRRLAYERMAVRLGEDAFARGAIGDETMAATVWAFRHFRTLLDAFRADHVRAVATSAAREARNAPALVARIRETTGIELEVIDGLEEAQLIFTAVAAQVDLAGRTALLIDIGGGSVEVTVARDGRALGCETLKIGPVRLLQRIRAEGLAESDVPRLLERYGGSVESLLEAEMERGEVPELCVGTGGNIERLARLRVDMLGKKKTGKVKLADLELLIPRLLAMSVPERIERLRVRPDRADVIAIAALVLHMIVDEAGVARVLAPDVGLKDGLLARLARAHAPDAPVASPRTSSAGG